MEGVFAINKPKSISSAQVIRELQRVFNPSRLFAPLHAAERVLRDKENQHQKRRRKDKRLQVKLGHGGTLDPLATGVLIIGVGRGTKQLPNFLACTKSYEATMLLGAATDTYDVLGKVLSRAPCSQVSQEIVCKALEKFEGRIMQKPPIYSALRMEGKRLYEYAREGKELPLAIQARPVTVEEIHMSDWIEPENHNFTLPRNEAKLEEKQLDLIDLRHAEPTDMKPAAMSIGRMKRSIASADEGGGSEDGRVQRKWHKIGLRSFEDTPGSQANVSVTHSQFVDNTEGTKPKPDGSLVESNSQDISSKSPAIKLSMTVTSGFYVRSLCHDLGKAVGSLGVMSALVRTRQGAFELGKNVLAYEDLEKGEDVWGPKLRSMLEGWQNVDVGRPNGN